MRLAREFFKPRNEGVYLHICNHTVSMLNDQLPLGELEKVKFIQIFERYKVKYNIQFISLVVMSNHFHALVYCPSQKFTQDEAFTAYNQFHKKEKVKFKDDYRLQALMENSNNISEFMREVQREFSLWFNKSRPYKRKGALWQDRFQCQLIQSDVYLWSCLKYIEMNPVRAGITDSAEQYSYSSFGRWQDKHPYDKSFTEHILSLSGKEISMPEFKEYLSHEMKIMQSNDLVDTFIKRGEMETAQKIQAEIFNARNEQEGILEIFADPKWSSHKVIGSKDFIEKKYREWGQYKDSA